MAERHSTLPGRTKDLTGQTFGQLTVLSHSHNDPDKGAYWHCLCACGNKCVIRTAHMRSGDTRSLGCLKRGATKGGLYKAERSAWCNAIERCTNKNHAAYRHYGGRGIQVCKRWSESFEAFLKDLGPRPSPKHSLDRFPDNNGNYEPGNVRWATWKEQRRNSRQNQWLTFQGQTKTIAEWVEITGIRHSTILGRINRGWTVKEILTVSTWSRQGGRESQRRK
jgi:hypothetical protein